LPQFFPIVAVASFVSVGVIFTQPSLQQAEQPPSPDISFSLSWEAEQPLQGE
jgi:hypothetical protein